MGLVVGWKGTYTMVHSQVASMIIESFILKGNKVLWFWLKENLKGDARIVNIYTSNDYWKKCNTWEAMLVQLSKDLILKANITYVFAQTNCKPLGFKLWSQISYIWRKIFTFPFNERRPNKKMCYNLIYGEARNFKGKIKVGPIVEHQF